MDAFIAMAQSSLKILSQHYCSSSEDFLLKFLSKFSYRSDLITVPSHMTWGFAGFILFLLSLASNAQATSPKFLHLRGCILCYM
ncbi:hypothetical protein BDE02_04G169900 [Populus trichocarpa]|nr:hypothetical protein BDE02_04G169900 [Populus trichocarpa]